MALPWTCGLSGESERLLLGAKCRCVLGEMYKTEPILPGGPNDEDQMRLIAERCGPLNHKTFPNWDNLERYPGYPGMENHRWDLETPATPLYASAGQWG